MPEDRRLKVYWPHPKVEFNGKGISEYWLEAMEQVGFVHVDDYPSADIVFFSSDSQLRPELIGEKPTLAYFWGWLPERMLSRSFEPFARPQLEMLARCTRVIVPSPIISYQLCGFGIESQMCLPGINNKALSPDTVQVKLQVVFVSRIAKHKGLEFLMQAMNQIEPKVPLVVVGPGYPEVKKEYEALAASLKVPVSFVEPDDTAKARIIAESMVLAHPSTFEGFSLPPLEALYLAVPVVASDIPQHRYLLQEYAYYAQSVEGMADAIVQAINDQNGSRAKALAGQKHVAKNYSLDAAAGRLWAHMHQTFKEFWGNKIRNDPSNQDLIRQAYEAEHRRNWAYGMANADVNAPMRFHPQWARHWRAQHFIKELGGCRTVLDIGCGAVYPTIFAMAGLDVTGYDVSEEALAQAREIAGQWGVKIQTVQGLAQKLKFDDGVFDAVVLGEILEHVPDPEVVLAEAYRVTRHGGRIIVSTPYGSHHYDPMHIHGDEGGWNDDDMKKLAEPYSSQVVLLDKIAENNADPSCYLMVMVKS